MTSIISSTPTDVLHLLAVLELPIKQEDSAFMRKTDEALSDFVCGNLMTINFPNQNAKERLWIHRRCQQLHLQSESTYGQAYMKSVCVVKPEGWTMPNMSEVKTSFRAEDRRKIKAKQKEKKLHRSRYCYDCESFYDPLDEDHEKDCEYQYVG